MALHSSDFPFFQSVVLHCRLYVVRNSGIGEVNTFMSIPLARFPLTPRGQPLGAHSIQHSSVEKLHELLIQQPEITGTSLVLVEDGG